ncbi:flagellar hook-length control protein FliK [Paenarthrobacter sp. CCNWLY172]|uniref:flagellar hook-length control protein FliK n=1 Tax=unclassified Paenarthrobacter TaxID=2634190 RepID=UPI003076A878
MMQAVVGGGIRAAAASPAGTRAGGGGVLGGSSNAGAFDVVMASEGVASARFDGSLPIRWLERHSAQGTPETGGLVTDASTDAGVSEESSFAHFDGSLPIRWLERHGAQGTPEMGGLVSDVLGDAALGGFVPLTGNAPMLEVEGAVDAVGGDAGMAASGRVAPSPAAAESPAALDTDTEAQPAHFDGSLPIRRFLPSNPQQAVESEGLDPDIAASAGVVVAAGGPEVAPDLASDALPLAHFDGSLPIRWLERHGPQGTPEMDELEADVAAGAGGASSAGMPAVAAVPVVAPGPAAEASQSAHFDGSLPIRRLVPSSPQQAVESDADVPGAPVPGTQDLAADTSAHFDGSMPVRWLERHGALGTPETGVAALGTPETGVAALGTAASGTAGMPAVAAVPVVAPGPAAEASQSAHFDGSLPIRRLVPSSPQQAVESDADVPGAPDPGTQDLAADTSAHFGASLPVRWLERHGAQGTPEPGAIHAMPAPLTVHPAATPTTLPPTPAGTALQPTLQQPLTPQLAAPLFSLASAAPGEHVMTLRVSPEDLGPLTVRAHIDGTGVRIELFAPGDAGREAVRHVLPELRRGLEDSGASLSLSSHNSPTDTGKDPGQGSGSATRDAEQPARRDGDRRANSTEDQPQQPRQPPPGVVPDASTTNRLDILV